MVRVRLPTPHAACNAIERQTSKIRPIVGSGSYARCGTSDKFVSAVISHESPANGPKGEWDVGARTPLVRSGSGTEMKRDLRVLTAAGVLLTVLAGCGKSRDFGKTVMKRARNGNSGLIKSTGYEGAKGDESGWKHHRPTFSAAC
jgi:hypothetical protein